MSIRFTPSEDPKLLLKQCMALKRLAESKQYSLSKADEIIGDLRRKLAEVSSKRVDEELKKVEYLTTYVLELEDKITKLETELDDCKQSCTPCDCTSTDKPS